MTHRGKTTLAAINFGKTASRRRNPRREKTQVTIVVKRSGKTKPSWIVRVTITETATIHPQSVLLPADFKPKYVAVGLAEDLATAYRKSGCNVALDTSGRH